MRIQDISIDVIQSYACGKQIQKEGREPDRGVKNNLCLSIVLSIPFLSTHNVVHAWFSFSIFPKTFSLSPTFKINSWSYLTKSGFIPLFLNFSIILCFPQAIFSLGYLKTHLLCILLLLHLKRDSAPPWSLWRADCELVSAKRRHSTFMLHVRTIRIGVVFCVLS